MKNIFLAIALCVSITSFSQGKFIEVTVTDTVTLKPKNYRCNIYGRYSDTTVVAGGYAIYDPSANEKVETKKLQDLKKLLEKKQYTVKLLNDSPSRPYFGNNYLSVVVDTDAEITKVIELLNSKNVGVHVEPMQYKEQEGEELLVKKVLDRARTKAETIGAHSGMRLGKIVEVREIAAAADAGVLFSRLSNLLHEGDFTSSLSKTFVVKFAAE